MALSLALNFAFIAITAWFLPHCARPALTAQRGSLRAHWLVRVVTIGAIVVIAIASVAWLAKVGGSAKVWAPAIAAGLWSLVVGLGYPRYTLLLRITGGRLASHPR